MVCHFNLYFYQEKMSNISWPITSLKLYIFLFNQEVIDGIICYKNVLYMKTFCFLRSIFLHSLVCAERRPCSLFGLPQVSLQPLCGCPHQKKLGAGPSSLLPTVSVGHPHPSKTATTHSVSVVLKQRQLSRQGTFGKVQRYI